MVDPYSIDKGLMVDWLGRFINFRSLLSSFFAVLCVSPPKIFLFSILPVFFTIIPEPKMTSTNFNVGIGDVKRNTSKVLKPPGGGSSDIFGTASCDEVNPHKRGTNQKNLQSSIILGGQSPKHINGTTATNGNSDKPDGNPVTGEGYEAPKPTITPAQHVSAQSEPAPEQKKTSRVPPGGYSSGLW